MTEVLDSIKDQETQYRLGATMGQELLSWISSAKSPDLRAPRFAGYDPVNAGADGSSVQCTATGFRSIRSHT
jgi:hypothetical protein